MTSRTAWTAGNGVGLTWTAAFQAADAGTMITGDTVLSSAGAITNGTALDMFADLSAICTISSSTVVAGANFAFWIYVLQEDGSTYGDGQLVTPGTVYAKTPAFSPCTVMPLYAAASQTTLVGFSQGIVLPPGSFLFAVQNNSGFTLTAATIKYRTYNINLNA